MTNEPLPLPHLMRLADGRLLGWYEFGDPAGRPCLYHPGTPASGLAGIAYDAAAAAEGVRWISIDRPGYGVSDPRPGRTLLDWPSDVAELADHLGIDRFTVAGESGGAPHALATAYVLPERVTTTLVIAGFLFGDQAWVRHGMNPALSTLALLGQRAPWAVPAFLRLLRRAPKPPLERLLPADREAMTAVDSRALQGGPDAYRQGAAAAIAETRLVTSPPGFPLEAVTSPIHLWHGTADDAVPYAAALRATDVLPNSTLHTVEHGGHLLAWTRQAEIVRHVAH
ncbi:alpha/beta fold hydrolase [Kribbella sp. CA-253562]|uniref:alpha/beta fold hydrolase n=1 Tax=Kribbella sp. CA-253562 TaxID=3239942 RepID=UPI003D90FA3C